MRWLLLLMVFAGCSEQPVRIRVSSDLDAPNVTAELLDGLEFYCQEQNLDYGFFQDRLKIEVYAQDFLVGGDQTHVAYYNASLLGDDKIRFVWYDGIHANSYYLGLVLHEINRYDRWSEFDMSRYNGKVSWEAITLSLDMRKRWAER